MSSTRQDSDATSGIARHRWSPRITVVLRAVEDGGGYEAVATEGVPYGVAISAQAQDDAYDAYAILIAALMHFRFDGEILLEDRSRRGRVRREVLR